MQPSNSNHGFRAIEGGSQRRDDWQVQEFQHHPLGEGTYGNVCMGRIWGVPTAIKIFHEGAMRRESFFQQASKLISMKHPNVVQVYSVSTQPEQPIKVAIEYMENSVSLQSFLRTSRGRTLSISDLGFIAFQVANGMECVESLNLVHSNITANKVLIMDNLITKISDVGFGLAIQDKEYCERRGNNFPYQWCPLECILDGIFSIKADVWSFGVLLWVIFSHGQPPFPGISNDEVVNYLSEGNRLKKPANAPDDVYKLMKKCWNVNPEKRPSFASLKSILNCYNRRVPPEAATQHVPNIPTSLVELGAAILSNVSRYGEIRKEKAFLGVTTGAKKSLIFVVPQLIGMLKASSMWHMDGTFKTVPSSPPFSQLFSIMATVGNKVYPTVIALMEGKDKTSYEELFQELIETYELRPVKIMTNFESSLRSALKRKFPDAVLKGCWFHYAQLIIQKVRSAGYSQLLSETGFKKAVQLMIALPLLPAEKIRDGLQYVKTYLMENGHEEPSRTLIPYIQKKWLDRVSPSVLSVFDESTRTNNGIESYHAGLLHYFKKPHPGVWEFIDGILHTAKVAVLDSERQAEGLPVSFTKKSKWVYLDEKISRQAQKYRDKKITREQYMLKCANYFSNGLTDIVDSVGEIEESKEQELQENVQDEASRTRNCVVCLSNPRTHIATPCGHLSFCEGCISKLNNNLCPVCRNTCSFIRVFQS